MDDVNEHLDEYNNIPKDVKDLIVELYKNGNSIDQIIEEVQYNEHDVVTVLSEAKCLNGGVYKRNHPGNNEAETADELRSRKKINNEKVKADRKNGKNDDPVYYDTGANYFAYSTPEGEMKTHTEFNSFWEEIFKYWVLYLRRELSYDVIVHDLENIAPGEKPKYLFSSLEKDLKLNSRDSGKIADCKGKIRIRNNNIESPIIGIERFSVIYNYEREGVIDNWDVMRCLVINKDLYEKLKAVYYEDLAKNKSHGYTPYKRAWLEDFDGFDEIFVDFIQNKNSIHDMALKLSTDKKKIREEMIMLKVILYAKSLNLSDADKDGIYHSYMYWHTITIRNGYRASYEESATTDETENETCETFDEAPNETEENGMVETVVKRHPSGVHLTPEEKEETKAMFKEWVLGNKSISHIAHDLGVTDATVRVRFDAIRKTLSPENQKYISNITMERKEKARTLSLGDFSELYREVLNGSASEWDVMDILQISKVTYDRMVKKYEEANPDEEEKSDSEPAPEVKTVEDDGKPYWIDKDGVKRVKGHSMEYTPEIALKFADELAQRNELIKKNNTSTPKIDEEEVVVESAPAIIDKVIISRKPIVVGTYTPEESAFVDSRAYAKMVDANKAFIKQTIHFEGDKPQEEMILFASKNLDTFSLLALTTACKDLGVTFTLSRTDEETGEEISRAIVSNPEGYDLAICDMFPNDSKVELLGINSMDDVSEAKSIILGVYSEVKLLKYRLRVISTDEDLLKEKYKELINSVMDSSEHIAVGIYDSHLKDGVVVDDLKSNMLFTNFS